MLTDLCHALIGMADRLETLPSGSPADGKTEEDRHAVPVSVWRMRPGLADTDFVGQVQAAAAFDIPCRAVPAAQMLCSHAHAPNMGLTVTH